jgi:uncharacterized BrkB/YihY/UPF0761 family membrane protein
VLVVVVVLLTFAVLVAVVLVVGLHILATYTEQMIGMGEEGYCDL